MKKIFLITCIAGSLIACNNSGTDATDDNVLDSDTTMTTTTSSSTAVYTPVEGDVTYRNGNLMVWKGNDWVMADDDVTLDNGVVVYKNGEVKKEGKTVTLDDGEVVNHSGDFFDKTGHAISDAWDATKTGVKKAGEAVEDAAKSTKDAVDNDNDK